MVSVEVREGETLEEALRRFKQDLDKTGRLRDARRHERYEKPSQRKRRELQAARRRRARQSRH